MKVKELIEKAVNTLEPVGYGKDLEAVEYLDRALTALAAEQGEKEKLEKWQIKPSEAICLTDLSCRHKKVFKND